jgi:serine/threonine protein kinase
VVSYILLCGCPPFQEESSRIFDQIKGGCYDFHEEQWSRVSPSAVDFISRMLTLDQRDRWTAQQLLTHPWLCCSYQCMQSPSPTPPPTLDICLSQLKRFAALRKLKAIARVVVATNRMKKVLRSSSSERGTEALRRYQETHLDEGHQRTTEPVSSAAEVATAEKVLNQMNEERASLQLCEEDALKGD